MFYVQVIYYIYICMIRPFVIWQVKILTRSVKTLIVVLFHLIYKVIGIMDILRLRYVKMYERNVLWYQKVLFQFHICIYIVVYFLWLSFNQYDPTWKLFYVCICFCYLLVGSCRDLFSSCLNWRRKKLYAYEIICIYIHIYAYIFR